MKKEGKIATFIIVIMITGLIALFLIIIFPQGSLGKVRDAAFLFGIGALPEERAPEFLGSVEIPPELEQDFDILVDNINNAVGEDECLVYTSELRIDDKWLIELTENKAQIWKKSKYDSRGASATGKKTSTLINFKPCKLKDILALGFYNGYLRPSATGLFPSSIPQEDIVFGKDEKIKFLFKSSTNNVCYIKSYDDGGTSCDSPRNNGEDGIDDDCRFKMPYYRNAPFKIKSTCTDLCKQDISICGQGKVELNCIGGVDDENSGGTARACDFPFDFESSPIDDYCICGDPQPPVIPLDYDHFPDCDEICDDAGGLKCMLAVDNGNDIKECDDDGIRFEGVDDYCVCGSASEKIAGPKAGNHECGVLCPGIGSACMIGIDEGDETRECDDDFDFENSEEYCFCGEASDKIGGSNEACGDVCATISKECLLGIDEGKNAKKCTDNIDFDDGRDYCICGDASQKIVPLPYPEDASCSFICNQEGFATCGKGVQNNDDKLCSDNLNFDQDDDKCVCTSDSQRVDITTYWQGPAP